MWTKITRPKYERDLLRYASDLTDGEWKVLEPLLPRAKALGRPRTTALREVVNAIPGLVFCPPAEHREPMSGLAIPFSMWQCAGHGDAAGPGFVR